MKLFDDGKKYRLTDQTKEIDGVILHRIEYADGTIGGWIESEENLYHDGNARTTRCLEIW